VTAARAQLARFLESACFAVPALRAVSFKVRTFGGSNAMADTLIALIQKGEKTGTFALESEFVADPAAIPRVDDHYVVTRFDATPVLIYRVTAVETLPFKDIDERHTQVEGAGARALDVWRKIHWEYWGPMLRAAGLEPNESMRVVWQRFRVVYGVPE
jgi:uncharacterized protein YhfF